MKKLIVAVSLVLSSASAVAWQNKSFNNGSNNSFNNSGYTSNTGNTGTNYQYNLNNIGDQIRYQSDAGAQIRDSIGGNTPSAQIDRSLGQPGGGIRW